MVNYKYKHTKYLYGYLFALLAIITLFSPFVYAFSFQNAYSYHLAVFVVTIVDIALIGLVFIAEVVSLKFDRTASKNTMFSTLFILLSYLSSNDIIFLVNFAGGEVPAVLKTVINIFHHIFLLAAILCFFTFFERDFKLKIDYKIHFICFGVFAVINIIFNCLNIFYGLPALVTVELFYMLFFVIKYAKELRNCKDNYAAMTVLILIIVVVLSSFFDNFTMSDRTFLGINGFYHLIIAACYLTIYIDFFMKKTIFCYAYEDELEAEKEKKSHVLKVNCFHCFDCFYDDEHLDFPSKKAKELFALLIVLRGKSLSIEKAITCLWPDKDVEKAKLLYRNAIMKLRQYFKQINCSCLSFKRGETILDIYNIICDYYDVLDGKKGHVDEPLLPEYEWSLEFENSL